MRKIECEFCDKIFDADEHHRDHLKEHLIEWEEKSRRLKRPKRNEKLCELCYYRTSSEQLSCISRHIKTYHKATKPMRKVKECYICYLESAPDPDYKPKLFYSYEGIRIHIKREHESPDWKYVCNICESRFENASGLDFHKKTYHLTSKKNEFDLEGKKKLNS